MKQANLLRIAGISGALAVMAGAFGAHILKDKMDASSLASFETAARYHLIHSVVMLLIAMGKQNTLNKINWTFTLIFFGVLFFSGSLYALTLLSINSGDQFNWLGAVTPIGGLLLIAGWGSLAFNKIGLK